MEQKKHNRFTPGMKCPGCPKVLNCREDCHIERLMCHACGLKRINDTQRRMREAMLHKCADCNRKCGRQAMRCGKCAQAHVRANPALRQPKSLIGPAQFSGFRGPGSVMDGFMGSEIGVPYSPKRGRA